METLFRILPYLTTLVAAGWALYLNIQRQKEKERDRQREGIAAIEVARMKVQSEREARLFDQQEDLAEATLAELGRLRELAESFELRYTAQRVAIEDLSRKLFEAEREVALLRGELR